MIFEFTGDDDFWLYVDGELVLDIGGVHSAKGGSVNFRTGQVIVNNQPTSLYELFYNNYLSRDGHTAAEAQAYVDGIFVRNKEGNYVFRDYTVHEMKVYYMERGAGASNLNMHFNLSSVTPGNVLFAKQLTAADPEDLNDMDYSLVQYPFQIY